MNDSSELLTVLQTAELLGVSPSAIRNDIADNRLEAVDLGEGRRPRWMVRRPVVESILATGGREDRRGVARKEAAATRVVVQETHEQLQDARRALALAHEEISRLRQEVAQLKIAARNANAAVLAQTETLQQLLIDAPAADRTRLP